MGLKEVLIGVVLVGLFSFAMITFGGQTYINNASNTSILDDPALKGFNTTIRNNLGNIESQAQTEREKVERQEAIGGTSDSGFSLTSIVSVVTSFWGTAIGTTNLIFTALSNILGIPKIVFNIIMGSLIIVVLLLGWKVIRSGGT